MRPFLFLALVSFALLFSACPFPPGPAPLPPPRPASLPASSPASPPSSLPASSPSSKPADLPTSPGFPASPSDPSKPAQAPDPRGIPTFAFGPQNPEQKRWQKQVTPIFQRTFKRLLTRLMQITKQKGIPGALSVCGQLAQPLTSSVGRPLGIRVSRISHRPRNPANAASPAELLLIQAYLERQKAKKDLPPVFLPAPKGKGRKTMYAPILLPLPLCLQCHGKPHADIQAPHLTAIQTLYPHDQATGFALGDLRGLWKAEW